MSLLGCFYIGDSFNNRRGLRLPLLLGRLHLGLVFCGNSCSSSRKSSSDSGTLRSFLFIVTVLITKCGSSTFPINREKSIDSNNLSVIPASTSRPTHGFIEQEHDLQEMPMNFIISQKIRTDSIGNKLEGGRVTLNGVDQNGHKVKTLGYFLKGLILPMLISLTLSFGFVIYKNRAKRARLQAIQNALEEARTNPNHLPVARQLHGGGGGIVSNALLSVIDSGEWSLISGGSILEFDDYIGEGGETARHMPLPHDKPPDYSTVFDPPTYEEATSSLHKSISFVRKESDQLSPLLLHSDCNNDDEGEDELEGKQLVSNTCSSVR